MKLRQKLKVALAVLVFAVVALALGRAALSTLGSHAPAEAPEPPAAQPLAPEQPQQQDAEAPGPAEPEPEEAAQEAQPAPSDPSPTGLTQRQQALAGSYGELEEELAALLAANSWADPSGTAVIAFGEGSWTEARDAAGEIGRRFAVSKVRRASATSDAGTTDRIVAVLDMGEGDEILEATRLTAASGAVQPWKISCDAFSYASEYVQASPAAGAFSLVDATGGALRQVLETEAAYETMESIVSSIAASSYPTASRAVWDGAASYDYAAGTCTLRLVLDNASSTSLGVMHVLGTDAVEIDKGASR